MQHLILSRHGNTFAPGDAVVWVGAKNDLPLVESGIQQSEYLAESFLSNGVMPDIIYCGPLKRTKRYAENVRERLKVDVPVIIDPRLNEIDYGAWSGLTDAEVIEKFGIEDFENWTKHGIWPRDGGWTGSEREIFNEVASFTQELPQRHSQARNILAITSNGRLRYFLKLFPNLFADYSQRHKLTVNTGKVCVLAQMESTLKLVCWNLEPKRALSLMEAKSEERVP